MQVNTYITHLSIRESKTGKGIFTDIDIREGKYLCELKGRLITCFESDSIDEKTRSNTIRYSSKYYLSPAGELGDFLNHSCTPNSYIFKKNKKLFLKSSEDILKNQEITIDYSTIIAPDDVWEMICHCQNKNCRKIIKSFNKIPKNLRDNYLSRKMVPSYIYNYGRQRFKKSV